VRVGVVFDTSALLAHLRLDRVSTGELIMVVAENGDVTGVPALAALDVMSELDQDERQRLVQMLSVDPEDDNPIVVLPLMASDLLDVDRLTPLVGSRGAAQAVVEAHKNGTSLATCSSAALANVMHPDDIEILS
jgi:hypothetical protein